MAGTTQLSVNSVDRTCRTITGGRLQNLSKHLPTRYAKQSLFRLKPWKDFVRQREYANTFFIRIRELNLEPKLVVFPRNQPQLINSRYVEVIRGFRRSEPFEAFVAGEIHHPTFRYSDLIALGKEFDAKLVARAFTGQVIVNGVVADFPQAIGLDPSRFGGTDIRNNQTGGPFTVSVARDASRLIANSARRLTGVQARRCKRKLTLYLQKKGLADTGY
jgi:hypothetical protein